MAYIDDQLVEFKRLIEDAIIAEGAEGKNKVIKSSKPINLIHDAVKKSLIDAGVDPSLVRPQFENTKPEMKMAGFIKQKKQDVCVIPKNITKVKSEIDWGPMAHLRRKDEFGYEFSRNSLVINVRSQMSSLGKNYDTLFERTVAEAQNLHMRYPDIVLGEVYLIPVYEYDDAMAKENIVEFSTRHSDIENYISFFSSISGRTYDSNPGEHSELINTKSAYKYERCTLLIVDFNRAVPKLYQSSAELLADGLISDTFGIEYADISFGTFANDILEIYGQRFVVDNLMLNP